MQTHVSWFTYMFILSHISPLFFHLFHLFFVLFPPFLPLTLFLWLTQLGAHTHINAHTQLYHLCRLFLQTCKAAWSVLPVGYLALSLSARSLSSRSRTRQVTHTHTQTKIISQSGFPKVLQLLKYDGIFSRDGCMVLEHLPSLMGTATFSC